TMTLFIVSRLEIISGQVASALHSARPESAVVLARNNSSAKAVHDIYHQNEHGDVQQSIDRYHDRELIRDGDHAQLREQIRVENDNIFGGVSLLDDVVVKHGIEGGENQRHDHHSGYAKI